MVGGSSQSLLSNNTFAINWINFYWIVKTCLIKISQTFLKAESVLTFIQEAMSCRSRRLPCNTITSITIITWTIIPVPVSDLVQVTVPLCATRINLDFTVKYNKHIDNILQCDSNFIWKEITAFVISNHYLFILTLIFYRNILYTFFPLKTCLIYH